MKVITSEAVIIQRIKAVPSKESWTKDPNYMAKYSSLDGSDAAAVKSFQEWANKANSAQLVVDGAYGPKTKAAYSKWGADWEKAQQAGAPKNPAPATKPVVDPATKDFVVTTTKTGLIDKFKALSMPAKIGIGIGAAAVLGLITWTLIPSKK